MSINKLKNNIKEHLKNIKSLLFMIQKERETIDSLTSQLIKKDPLCDFSYAWTYTKPNNTELQSDRFEKHYAKIQMYQSELTELIKRHNAITLLYVELKQQLILLQYHGLSFVSYKCKEYYKDSYKYSDEHLNDLLKEHFKNVEDIKKLLKANEILRKKEMDERQKQQTFLL